MDELLNDPMWMVFLLTGLGSVVFFSGRWVGQVNSDRKKFHELIDEIREDIKKILSRLPVYSVSQDTPLRLNELGEEIASELGLPKWARETANQHLEAVQCLKPFEIQDYCYDFLNTSFVPTLEQETMIKECAYENGLKREQVIDVFVIVLRDHLISRSSRLLDLRSCLSAA